MTIRPTLSPMDIGSVEGRAYHLVGVIGQGGQGTVYRAWLSGEAGFRRPVAIKLLNNDSAASLSLSRRLRDEARLLGMVRHRAIVHVEALIRLEGRQAIVMEYVAAPPLHELICRSPLPAPASLELVAELAAALHVAITTPGPEDAPLRLVHRDIKPSNILLTPAGEVKILDFGIARADYVGRESQTRAGPIGTVGYMSPEVLAGTEPAGPPADIFALGVVLVECLTGRSVGQLWPDPAGYHALVEDLLRRCARASSSPELAELIRAMLCIEPSGRPEAREVERRCSALARSLPGPGLRDWAEQHVFAPPAAPNSGQPVVDEGALPSPTQAAVEWTVQAAPVEPTPPTVLQKDELPPPRGTWVLSLCAGLALLLVMVPVLWLWTHPPISPQDLEVTAYTDRAHGQALSGAEAASTNAPARVLVSGELVRVEILRGEQSYRPGQELSPGRYTVYATFDRKERGRVGELELRSGETRQVSCDAVTMECRLD